MTCFCLGQTTIRKMELRRSNLVLSRKTVEENYGHQKLLLSAPVSVVRQASCFTTAVLQLQGKKLSEKKIVMCLLFEILRQGVTPCQTESGSTVVIGRTSQDLNGGMCI